jgi:5-oxoprolinase (ATP-hydrolysing)
MPGETRVERSSGEVEVLDSTASVEVKPGDAMVIATPGGGGYGAASHVLDNPTIRFQFKVN